MIGRRRQDDSLSLWALLNLGPDDDTAWVENAVCPETDPEAFYPDKGGSTRQAKQVCLGCPVRDECLEYALEHGEKHGIWGGLSERQRRPLLAQRNSSEREAA